MIRIVTLDEIDPAVIAALAKTLYTTFGVGAEHTDTVTVPHGQHEPYDGNKLLDGLPRVQAFSDDKVLFVTTRKLAPRKLVSGEAPTYGLSRYNAQRCLVTSAHLKTLDPDTVKTLARFAMQEVGHAFGLHHCLDARCAMYAQWTPSYPLGEASFCTFCREQSEQKIRQTKS
jgi:predicted Zn-dependent protease